MNTVNVNSSVFTATTETEAFLWNELKKEQEEHREASEKFKDYYKSWEVAPRVSEDEFKAVCNYGERISQLQSELERKSGYVKSLIILLAGMTLLSVALVMSLVF